MTASTAPRRRVRRFDPALIRHREPGVLGELETVTADILAQATALADWLESFARNGFAPQRT